MDCPDTKLVSRSLMMILMIRSIFPGMSLMLIRMRFPISTPIIL